ncbi:GlsB/YeaQ/YmgE family stress response membrane protein [Patulibacter sp. S7RM1-6]
MGIVAWIVLGFVAGMLARAIVPGNSRLGCLTTTAVGILGALVGGAIASAADVGELGTFFDLGTWALAVLGSVLLLLILQAVAGRGPRRR